MSVDSASIKSECQGKEAKLKFTFLSIIRQKENSFPRRYASSLFRCKYIIHLVAIKTLYLKDDNALFVEYQIHPLDCIFLPLKTCDESPRRHLFDMATTFYLEYFFPVF